MDVKVAAAFRKKISYNVVVILVYWAESSRVLSWDRSHRPTGVMYRRMFCFHARMSLIFKFFNPLSRYSLNFFYYGKVTLVFFQILKISANPAAPHRIYVDIFQTYKFQRLSQGKNLFSDS